MNELCFSLALKKQYFFFMYINEILKIQLINSISYRIRCILTIFIYNYTG